VNLWLNQHPHRYHGEKANTVRGSPGFLRTSGSVSDPLLRAGLVLFSKSFEFQRTGPGYQLIKINLRKHGFFIILSQLNRTLHILDMHLVSFEN
jgi:hypothetical protein